jgi:hypothetical protein
MRRVAEKVGQKAAISIYLCIFAALPVGGNGFEIVCKILKANSILLRLNV